LGKSIFKHAQGRQTLVTICHCRPFVDYVLEGSALDGAKSLILSGANDVYVVSMITVSQRTVDCRVKFQTPQIRPISKQFPYRNLLTLG